MQIDHVFEICIYSCYMFQDDVQLTVSDQYQLQLPLPHKVKEQSASAKFSKKSSTLTLSLACVETDDR